MWIRAVIGAVIGAVRAVRKRTPGVWGNGARQREKKKGSECAAEQGGFRRP